MSNITYRSARLLRATFIQLHLQQKAGLFCDVFLQAEGEVISAHACVLSACSNFFTERLNGTKPNGQPTHLHLPGMKPTTLHKLVHYLYTSELEVTREELDGVLAAARQLHIAELEVLQLQGAKLVRTDSWPRLNRKCFQTCDQPSLRGAAKVKDSQDIKQELMPDSAAEKCSDVVKVEGPRIRLSDTFQSRRCCQTPVGPVDYDERYTDSEPSCSPLHTPSGGSEKSASLNSPTPSSCESLEPVLDTTESSTESSLQTVQRIKLRRLRFSMPPNILTMPAPGRVFGTLDISRRTGCPRTATKEKSQEWTQLADNKSPTACSQEHFATSSLKKSVPKSIDGMVRRTSPIKKTCRTSVGVKNLECWEITNRHSQSEKDHKVNSRIDKGQVIISETTHVFSHANGQKENRSIASCDTSGGVGSEGPSNITNKSQESENNHKRHSLENLTRLPICETAGALSCANKIRECVSWRPGPSVAGCITSRGGDGVGKFKITRNAQLENGQSVHGIEEFRHVPLAGSADTLSPADDQRQSIQWNTGLSSVRFNPLGAESCMGQSKFTSERPRSEKVDKELPFKEVTWCESANVSSASNNWDSVRRSPSPTSANCATSTGEGRRGKSRTTSRSPQLEDVHKANPMEGRAVYESSNAPSPTDSRMISVERPVQRDPFPAPIREDSKKVHQSEEQLDLMLTLSAPSQPTGAEQTTIRQGRDVETKPADKTILMPIGGEEEVDNVTKQSSPEWQEGKKDIQPHEVSECTIHLLNNDLPAQDVTVKLNAQNILKVHQTPHSVHAPIEDAAREVKCRKRPVAAGKKTPIPSQKSRRRDHSSLSTVKVFHKACDSGTTTSSVVSQSRVSGGSDAASLDEAVSGHTDYRTVTSSGEVDPTVDCFRDSLIELSLPDEDEEIDVGGSVCNGYPGITSCGIRPDPSSESDIDVNVLD